MLHAPGHMLLQFASNNADVCAGEALGGARIGIIIVAQLLPIDTPPQRIHSGGLVPTGHVVCRMSVRSTQADVIDTVMADPPRFLLELFGRTLVEGINAGRSISASCSVVMCGTMS